MNYINSIKYFTILWIILSLSAQNGCDSKNIKPKKIKSTITEAVTGIAKTYSFSITISNGGGFTGLKNGYTFNSTGMVKRWRQLSFVKDTTIWEIKTDGIKTNEFKTKLLKSGILNKKYNNTGNITFVLTYQTADTTYTWSWNGKNAEKNTPAEIKDWFKEVTDFIVSLKKKN